MDSRIRRWRHAWVKDENERKVKLKANFPKGGPYVLTHGDLNDTNVFVSNDDVDKKMEDHSIH